ncbi:MAG: hypothetical protein HOB41_26025 [Gemmatimonadetes bacterium]|nr:hypothetical protein [Gemmatimonadota bacterium]
MRVKEVSGASWLWIVLLLGLSLRLFGLMEPLIDKQAWRQTDTAAIARNYYEEGYTLFHPRVDWRGTSSGFVESNFPLYPFVVGLLYSVVGGAYEWVGRLVAALCSTAAGALLYLLALRLGLSARSALFGSLFYLLFPLSVYYGRTFMPEALMIFLSVAALWAFARWIDSGTRWDFVLAVWLAALCFLVKIPTLYLGFPLVALAWERWGGRFVLKPSLWLYFIAAVLPTVFWYWHASLLFEDTGLTFGIWNRYGYDKWDRSILFGLDFYQTMLVRFWHSIYTPIGALLVLFGLSLPPSQRREWVLWVWLGGLLCYVFLVPEGNRKLHYYQLPFVPVGALLAGRAVAALLEVGGAQRGWSRIARNWTPLQRVVLVGILVVGSAVYGGWAIGPYYDQPNNLHKYYESCYFTGGIVDDKLPREAKLVVGDLDENAGAPHRAQSPTLLYYCHRKGWQITPDESNPARLDSLAAAGADFFLIAGGFAMGDKALWNDLLRRGVSIPSAYPRKWHDGGEFTRYLSRQRGDDRHFILVSLSGDLQEQ